jgi:hypothetical protein
MYFRAILKADCSISGIPLLIRLGAAPRFGSKAVGTT